MADPRYYVVYICKRCGEQQWYAGSCGELCCGGRSVAFAAVLKEDIEKHAKRSQDASSPVPREFIKRFVDSLFRLCSSRSG